MDNDRVTPEEIINIKPDEVFVFGSNTLGVHGAGAAFLAKMRFGAIQGQGIGLQGRSYALPTKDDNIQTLPLSTIQGHVNDFISFARRSPQLKFYVTKVGCGLAGLTIDQVAPMFRKHSIPDNVWLPIEFW